MATETETLATTSTQSVPKTLKRKYKQKGKKPSKKLKGPRNSAMAESRKRKKPSKRMLHLFSKRAKRYNSDSDEEEESEEEEEEGEEKDRDVGLNGSDEEEGAEHSGVTRLSEGCRVFKVAFLKIMKKNLPNDPLGPILAAHKKLVASKLAEEEEDHKSKGHVRKEKQLIAEKGHVKPESYLAAKEKLLVSIATKGVVRLFNAVSKAQNPQKGLNPSLSKDAKALAKQRKQTFLSELKKPLASSVDESNELGWAPLRDSYMLGSKLKDWDKTADAAGGGTQGDENMQSSSDEE